MNTNVVKYNAVIEVGRMATDKVLDKGVDFVTNTTGKVAKTGLHIGTRILALASQAVGDLAIIGADGIAKGSKALASAAAKGAQSLHTKAQNKAEVIREKVQHHQTYTPSPAPATSEQ